MLNNLTFFEVIFAFLKFTLVSVLFSIGILILFRLRGVYLQQRIKGDPSSNNRAMRKVRLILGFTYIIIGFGILFNYLTYMLIWSFRNFNGILLLSLNSLTNVIPEEYCTNLSLFIELFHPIIAILSFSAILQYFMALFYLINNNRVISNPKKAITLLVISNIEILFFGMECLPYLL
jgi:hypothetical protein